MSRLRNAEEYDYKELVKFGEYFWKQTPYVSTGMEYDPSAVKKLLKDLREGGLLKVYENGEGKIVGFIGVMIFPFHFNPSYIFAQEMFFFIHPEYRGSGLGTLILRGIEEELKDMGVHVLSMGEMRSSKDMEEMYVSQGFVLTERSFAKVI